MTIAAAATELNVAPSTLHRWLNEGMIAGEQVTPGRVADPTDRGTEARFTASAGEGFHHHARGHPCSRRHPSDGVAACKARRDSSRHVTKGGKSD